MRGEGGRPGRRGARASLLLALALAALHWPAAAAGVQDLRGLLEPGYILQDHNGDGHPDRIRGRVVIPSEPGEAEAAAAANLTARLTFESYASDLELLARDGAQGMGPGVPVVVVGSASQVLQAADAPVAEVSSALAPGEGGVVYLAPSASLAEGGVWVVGGDASGLLAAARYLAARYPAVWDPEGPSFAEFAGTLEAHLEEQDVPLADLVLDRVVVSSGRDGVSRLRASLWPEGPEAWERARELLTAGQDQLQELLPPGLRRLDLRLVQADGRDEIHYIRNPDPLTGEGEAWSPGTVEGFTLSDLYTLRGIYRDTKEDLIPDRTVAHISLQGGQGADAVSELAQRIALETAGLRLPLVDVAGREDPSADAGFPIAVGLEHHLTRRLLEAGRLGVPAEGPGRGFVELVPRAVDEGGALLIGGTDLPGMEEALRVVARRLPHLHDPTRPERRGRPARGSYPLADLETEVRRFFQARSAAGQVALGVYKLEQWLQRLEAGQRPGIPASDEPWPPGSGEPGGRESAGGQDAPGSPPLAAIHLELAVDSVPEGLAEYLEDRLRTRFPETASTVELRPTGFGAGQAILDRSFDFQWEVDRVREILREEGYPALEGAERGLVEVRVSEPPQVREALAGEIRRELASRELDQAVEVRVLNAYKQGYSWVEEVILPRLREVGSQGIARIEIQYHHLQDSDEIRWQVMGSDTRWLQELFPIDAVLSRELGISDSLVVLRASTEADPIYRVQVQDPEGAVILEDRFTPSYVVEPYFHLYPDYERVRISTGRVQVEADGRSRVDRRVATDMERFWETWQTEILPEVRDYLMDLHQGEIDPDPVPFFDELRIDARLSEPNHRIGVDEEVISSLESLHNDLYFHTLAFLEHLGQHYGVGPLGFPGRILPHIDPDGDGLPGSARVRLTGRSQAAPELTLKAVWKDGGEPGRWRYSLSPLPTEAPPLRGVGVRAGEDELERILFQVMARDSVDRFQEHRARASEEAIDRTLLSRTLLKGMVETVRDLHGHGVLGEALAFQGVAELAFRFGVEDQDEEAFPAVTLVPRSATPAPTRRPLLLAEDWEWDGAPMVQWQTPIPPAENDSVLARLATFPETHVYQVGRSLLGRDIYAADFLPPTEGRFRSQARLNALRPTLLLSGRQHANEVSSTSHILRLGELLVTDPEHRELLNRVNVVLHPIANPDGAQLAWEMQNQNPDFTLHAGYLGALGVDMTAQAGSDDPVYPEANVRPWLMETWLPDIYLNLHGYPSHEWVQHFSGYAAWVRGRTVTSRTWWAPRGWFVPGFSWVDDPDHPEIRTAQFAILDSMAAAITGEPEVAQMSRRQYARYAKYGRQDVEGFREHFHEGMLIYLSLRGRRATGEGPANPRINTFSAVTEAPDETARGEWLELVARAGLAHTSAMARYLATGVPRVEREAQVLGDGVERKVFRVRPVLPPGELDEAADGGEAGGGG